MSTLMAVLGIINALQQAKAGDSLGGIASVAGSLYNSGWFNGSKPVYDNTLGDFGVRRNYL